MGKYDHSDSCRWRRTWRLTASTGMRITCCGYYSHHKFERHLQVLNFLSWWGGSRFDATGTCNVFSTKGADRLFGWVCLRKIPQCIFPNKFYSNRIVSRKSLFIWICPTTTIPWSEKFGRRAVVLPGCSHAIMQVSCITRLCIYMPIHDLSLARSFTFTVSFISKWTPVFVHDDDQRNLLNSWLAELGIWSGPNVGEDP